MGSYKPVTVVDGEVWKGVTDWPMFEVSNHGRVRRISLLNPVVKNTGYPAVYLVREVNGKAQRKCTLVHTIVAEAFLGPRPTGYVIHHKDHGRTNPRPDNLKYVTPRENFDHAVRIGRMPTRMFGESSGRAKLTEIDVGEIRRLYKRGKFGCGRLSEMFGVTKHTIKMIVNGQTWAPRKDHHAVAVE